MTSSRPASAFTLRQGLPGGWHVCDATNRILAGVGHNAHRAWAFPFNTPRGVNTVQEYAFDHPFHNGLFVGQGNVRQGGRMANFWAVHADFRQAANPAMNDLGHLRYDRDPQAAATVDGARFAYRTTWLAVDGTPMLDEERIWIVRDLGDATLVEIASAKTAAYGEVECGVTKFGSIGARVQPQLLPMCGGQVVALDGSDVRRGCADEVASGQACDAVAFEAEIPRLGRAGLCLAIAGNTASPDRRGPWFLRDYGMAMFNPTMRDAVRIADAATWTVALRCFAYDGAITPERFAAWQRAAQ